MTSTQAYLILNMLDHVGPMTVKRLLQKFGTPTKILEADLQELRSIPGVQLKSAQSISEWRKLPWEQEIELVQKLQLELITQDSPHYPLHLKEIHDPPILLYLKGKLKDQEKNSLAIVGMRHPSHYGSEMARKFGYQLGTIGMSVISGLAIGIDTAAHHGCLQAQGHTVAVLGFGFDFLSKAESKKIATQLLESEGAILSEFPIQKPPNRQTFPMRNRIVSGISLGTLVVEAGINSGALITANFAVEQGRQVFALPGRIDTAQSQGCHRLIQNGAKLTQCIEDILEEFEYLLPKNQPQESSSTNSPPKIDLQFTETEQSILEATSEEEIGIDRIIETSSLPPSVVSATLLVLEMKRVVRQLPGKRYQRLIAVPLKTSTSPSL